MISNGKSMVAADSSLEFPEHHVGSRIECCGHFGTIKYIGPVEGHPGIWLGIDWDNFERGKHNGTVNGIHYFDARYPKSGSFVRREKVNFGQSLLGAIITRYAKDEDECALRIRDQQLLNFKQTINAPFIELVGFDKVANVQSNFESLEIVNVSLQNVSSIGKPLELKNSCPNIKEIDISKNLLSSWGEVLNICSQLEHLFWLNVSGNVLTFPENIDNYEVKFPNITVLICGYMNLEWQDILKLTKIFPNIRELRAPYNNITNLDTPVQNNFHDLVVLDLEGNTIRQWSTINKLSVINSLQHLILENIQLEGIAFESNEKRIKAFPNLTKLDINHNLIKEWKSIGELDKLKSLEDLRFMNNPILETENLETRAQIVIAKIANLKIFNGRLRNESERRGAEYDYIKKYGLEWIKLKDDADKRIFLEEHNRYLELINKYGTPEESELVQLPNTLKSSLITLTLIFEDNKLSKKLPRSMSVQKLIMMVQKLFKLYERPTLIYTSNENNIEILLDDELKEIGYYSMRDEDKIIVKI